MEEEGEEEDRQASEACASRAAEGATDSPSAATGMHRLASDGRHSGGGAGEMLCRAAALCCCFEQAQQQQQQQGQQAGDAPAPVSPAAAPRCSPLLATSLDPPGAGGSHGELSPQAAHPGQSTRDHKLQHMLDALCKQLETPATAHESEILVRLRQAVASRKEQQQQGSPRLPPFPQPGLLPAAGPARQQPQQQPPQQQQGSPQLPAFLQSVSMPPPAPTPQPVLGRLPLAGGAQVYPSAGEPSHLLGALVGLATQHGCPSAFAPFHHPHADEEQPRCTKMAATVPRISQPIRPTPSLVLPLSVIQLACAPRPQTQLPPSLAAARLDLLRQRLSPAMR